MSQKEAEIAEATRQSASNSSNTGNENLKIALAAARTEAETFLQQVQDAQSEEEANYEQLRSDLEGAVNGFQSRVTNITSKLTSSQLDERVRGLEAIISTIQNVAGGLFGQSTTADSDDIHRPGDGPEPV